MEEYLSEKEQWEWLKAQVRETAPAVIVAVALLSAKKLGRGMGAFLIALYAVYLAVNLAYMWQ